MEKPFINPKYRMPLTIALAVFGAIMILFVLSRFNDQSRKKNFSHLHLGMRKDSVVHFMGFPKRIIPGYVDKNLEMYDYGGPPLASDDYNVYFDDSNVVIILVHP